MGRLLLLFGAMIFVLSVLNTGGWEAYPIYDERSAWAALLPGVYIVGMLLLND